MVKCVELGLNNAPVVQRIEHLPSKEGIQVRFLAGALKSKIFGLAYDGGTTGLGPVRLGSTPSSPTKRYFPNLKAQSQVAPSARMEWWGRVPRGGTQENQMVE